MREVFVYLSYHCSLVFWSNVGSLLSCSYHSRFVFCVPPVTSPRLCLHMSRPPPSWLAEQRRLVYTLHTQLSSKAAMLHPISTRMAVQFPEVRLIQYDCGKLQVLDVLLRRLKSGQHRVLIFTQMTKMLNILEQFLNHHGHRYVRLDGTTRVEQRQVREDRSTSTKNYVKVYT